MRTRQKNKRRDRKGKFWLMTAYSPLSWADSLRSHVVLHEWHGIKWQPRDSRQEEDVMIDIPGLPSGQTIESWDEFKKCIGKHFPRQPTFSFAPWPAARPVNAPSANVVAGQPKCNEKLKHSYTKLGSEHHGAGRKALLQTIGCVWSDSWRMHVFVVCVCVCVCLGACASASVCVCMSDEMSVSVSL